MSEATLEALPQQENGQTRAADKAVSERREVLREHLRRWGNDGAGVAIGGSLLYPVVPEGGLGLAIGDSIVADNGFFDGLENVKKQLRRKNR